MPRHRCAGFLSGGRRRVLLGGARLIPFGDWLPMAARWPMFLTRRWSTARLQPTVPGHRWQAEQLVFSQEKRVQRSPIEARQAVELRCWPISNPPPHRKAREKFGHRQNAVAGWPLVEQGSQASALLVGGPASR